MKIILIVSFLFLFQFVSCNKQKYKIEAVYTSQKITIDGKPDESIWEFAKQISLKENRSGNDVLDPDLQTQVMACYDDSSLFFAFICYDPDIWTSFTERDEHLWEEEAVEIFIDVDDVPETYVEIEISPANILFDSYIVDPENIDVPETALFYLPGIRTAVCINGTLNKREDKDDNWSVEIAIPFADLANENVKRVTTNTEIKINFFRLDENKGMKRMSYAWSPTGARFHKPAVFGNLVFKQK